MSTEAHPSLFELECVHAGEGSAGATHHTRTCARCGAYLAELKREASAFAAGRDVDAFVSRIRAREVATRDQTAAQTLAVPRRRFVGGTYAIAASLGLGAVFIVANRPGRIDHGGALGTAPLSDVLAAKGHSGLQVAALVEHEGAQQRQSGEITGVPGDRFRVELTLTAAAVLDAWVVDESGRITELCHAQHFGMGTHYLGTALRFDEKPTTARLFVGPAGSLEQAREHHAGPQVIAVPIRGRGTP